jgi:hypothetical protein
MWTGGLGLTGPVDIYVINADGSGLRQLTSDGAILPGRLTVPGSPS